MQSTTEFAAASCSVVSFSNASSSVQCLTAAGVGKGLSWQVSVAGQMSGVVGNTSYQRPIVSFFAGLAASAGQTSGGQVSFILACVVHGVVLTI